MSDKWHGGKGSRYRPVDKEKYNKNWDNIFGKKDLKFATAEEYVNGVYDDEDLKTTEQTEAETANDD